MTDRRTYWRGWYLQHHSKMTEYYRERYRRQRENETDDERAERLKKQRERQRKAYWRKKAEDL